MEIQSFTSSSTSSFLTDSLQDGLKITLNGQVIAITGGNRGIGLAIGQSCLANGAVAVYSLDISEPDDGFIELQQLYAANGNRRLNYIKCDVTSESDVSRAVDQIVTECGRVDGLVVNAGISRHQPALDTDKAFLQTMFDINVFAGYACAIAVAKKFVELQIKGSIVFTASMVGYRPNRASSCSVYGTTKGAVQTMARNLALEWVSHGIRVNSVSPGLVHTGMAATFNKISSWNERLMSFGGMQRMAEPNELGGAYVYLLSSSASYTTGIDIPVAGAVGAW